MKHILIINGNPDSEPERLSHALARAYHEAAEDSGAFVRHINVGDLDFPLLRNTSQFALMEPATVALAAQPRIFR